MVVPTNTITLFLSLARSICVSPPIGRGGRALHEEEQDKTTIQDVCRLAHMLLVCFCWACYPYASTSIFTTKRSEHSGLDPTGATVLVCRQEVVFQGDHSWMAFSFLHGVPFEVMATPKGTAISS